MIVVYILNDKISVMNTQAEGRIISTLCSTKYFYHLITNFLCFRVSIIRIKYEISKFTTNYFQYA